MEKKTEAELEAQERSEIKEFLAESGIIMSEGLEEQFIQKCIVDRKKKQKEEQ